MAQEPAPMMIEPGAATFPPAPAAQDGADAGHGGGVNLLDAVRRHVTAGAGDGEAPSVAIRRHPAARPDVVVLMPSRSWAATPAGSALLARVTHDPIFDDVQHAGQRLTMRFAADVIGRVGAALEAGAPVGLATADLLAGRTYVVDFCDPNATKAFHVGHLRNLQLGHALASAIELAGGTVVRQSIVCDIGRNVCEAMAGYLPHDGTLDPARAGLKPDVFIGRCYADYVRQTEGGSEPAVAAPDAPLQRELDERDDLAQAILRRWLAEDPDVRRLWATVRRWVLDGQAATLDRLGIRFDRLVFESDALPDVERLTREGITRGIFTTTPTGAVVYATGQSEYEVVPLVRPDGFPTEHMRALVLWLHLQALAPLPAACVHVMGDEWLPSTLQREAMLAKLVPCPLFAVYHKIPYGMVSLAGSKMKSSTGEAVLIDDLLDALAATVGVRRLAAGADTARREEIARIIVAGFFLSRPPLKAIDFSWERFNDERANPGWALARGWAKCADAAALAAPPDPRPDDPAYRFAVCQSQAFRRQLHATVTTLNVAPVLRYLTHLADWYEATPGAPHVDRVMHTVFRAGLASLGVVTPVHPQRAVPSLPPSSQPAERLLPLGSGSTPLSSRMESPQ